MTRKVGDSLIRTILDMIFQGELKAGDRLPAIEEMARRHGISVVSVREAVQKLSLMGLVRIRQGEGTFLGGNIPSIVDILDARRHVEMATCLLAATRGTDEDFRRLDGIVEGMKADFRRRDSVGFTRKDLQFHLAIGRMSGNALLSAFLENIQELLYYLQERTHMLKGTIEMASRFHPEIADALRRRDGPSARLLMSEHIDAVKRAWTAFDRGRNLRGGKAVESGTGARRIENNNASPDAPPMERARRRRSTRREEDGS